MNDNELVNLVGDGFSNKEISIKINRTVSSIKNRCSRLNIKRLVKIYTTICLGCGKIISGTTKNFERKFCCKGCANTYTNKNRVISDRTKKKMSLLMSGENNPNYIDGRSKNIKDPIKKKCKLCGVNDVMGKRVVCDSCKYKYYDQYRPSTKFNFNVRDYPNEFNLTLLNECGWYSPSNRGDNLNGVSKDHLYSVSEGFKNGVSVDIIKHPANCGLMLHKENNIKNNNNSITLSELKEKIILWDEKYG